MFESIKAKLTTRNVLIGLTAVAAVGAAVYWFTRDKNAAEAVSDVVAGATENAADAVQTAGDVAENVVKAAADVVADAANEAV